MVCSRNNIFRLFICALFFVICFSFVSFANEGKGFDIHATSLEGSDKIQWHGYYEFEYWDAENSNATFDAHKIVTWLGVQVNEKVFVSTELEYEHFPRLPKNDLVEDTTDASNTKYSLTNRPGGNGEVKIDSAQLRITPIDNSVIYMGIFYVPFGIEYLSYPGQKNKLVTRPKVMKGGDVIPGTWSDIGVGFNQVVNGIGQVDVFYLNGDAKNGGIARDSEGGNNRKSLGARLMLDGLIDGFNIGGSFVSGEYDSANQNLATRTGVHFRIDSDKVTGISIAPVLLGEFISGKDEKASFDSNGAIIDRKVSGFYAQLSSKILPDLEIVARYGQYDNDEDQKDNMKTETSIGLGLHVLENFQIKGEYQINEEEGTESDNNVAVLQFVADW